MIGSTYISENIPPSVQQKIFVFNFLYTLCVKMTSARLWLLSANFALAVKFFSYTFLPAFPIHFPMQIKSNSTLHFPLHYIHLVRKWKFLYSKRNPKLFFMISDYGNLTLDKEEKIRHTSSILQLEEVGAFQNHIKVLMPWASFAFAVAKVVPRSRNAPQRFWVHCLL